VFGCGFYVGGVMVGVMIVMKGKFFLGDKVIECDVE